ncbi:uncharacterized protein TRIADDRAFT_53471 [Trichoplax adhaerens]|uniref:Polyprenal reductase n=1 Tax=Trichoplax adhaerens TaxID=10228 RepID=B3RPB2_TRIAD|nr:hypothetical protein TRIADDRAFT_53471 [Trichoplax adhaerens]EDV27606.1 hypothetical protein TRIADDRAFT_53471 [Trichoplax adhaerens]|eukprot:XP_002109440.1 hypothetical protein TRIADDRAFT_53471 [Trichoplax adhaerens]
MDGFALIWGCLLAIVLAQVLAYILCHHRLPLFIRATYEWGKLLDENTSAFNRKWLVPKSCNKQQKFLCYQIIIQVKEVFGYLDSANYYTIKTSSIILSLVLLSLQTFRRLYECLFISKFSQSAQMHLGHYLLGGMFYILVNLTIISDGSFLTSDGDTFRLKDLSTATNIIGVCIFCWGSLHQHRCHNILAQLRVGSSSHNNYGVPRGDWFNYVSCPHYLSEIIIYFSIGFILSLDHQSWWLLLAFITTMLSLGAVQTNQWYYQNFSNYPEDRRAIIPFLL